MNDSTISILLQQLAPAVPMLIVSLVGLVLAVIFIRKHTWPAVLTILAIVAFCVATGGAAFAQVYFLRFRLAYGWTNLQFGQMMSFASISTGLVRALGMALLLAAVFVGRKAKTAGRS